MVGAPAAAAGPGLQPGPAALFIDDALIESGAFTRTFHQPRKDGLQLEAPDVFGAPSTLEANGCIVYDPLLGSWVMFAMGFSSSGAVQTMLFRYTSSDGLSWRFGGRVLADVPGRLEMFSCYFDEAEQTYKGWPYLNFLGPTREGTYYASSSDGVAWSLGGQVTDAFSGDGDDYTFAKVYHPEWGYPLVGPSDVTVFAHDPDTGRFLGIFKFFGEWRVGAWSNHLRSRSYAWLDSLSEPVSGEALGPVQLTAPWYGSEEFYGSTAFKYEGLWLGGLKVYSDDTGTARIDLVSSRDGLTWRQHGRWLDNAPEGTSDGGYMTDFSTGPLRVGDELVFYYGASAWGKFQPAERRVSGGGIFRARLRLDGFASVTGTLTTKLLAFPRGRLTVNARGPVLVEVLDANGRELQRVKLNGDSIAHPVAARLPAVGRLRFAVEGELYSFRVTEGPPTCDLPARPCAA